MYKNMYKWVTDRIAKFSSLEADEPEVKLPELTIFISTNMSIPRNQFLRIIISFLEICSKINPQVSLHRLIRLISMNRKLMNRKLSHRNWQFLSQQIWLLISRKKFWESSFVDICNKINPQVSLLRSIRLIWMNRKLSYRNWQFLSQQLWLSLKISFWESSFVEICSKINPQVSLLVSLIRLIWMNRKLMNRKSMNRKSSYRNWKRKLSWTNLKFGNSRRPILSLVSFDLFAVPTFWFFHFVRGQHFLLHPILLLQLVLKLPNFFYVIWMFWDLEEFLKIVFDVLIGIKNKLSYEIVLESQKFKFDFIKSLAHCGLLCSILTGAIKSMYWSDFFLNKHIKRILFMIGNSNCKYDSNYILTQGLPDLDGRNSQKYLHQTQADF